MKTLNGWGRFPRYQVNEIQPINLNEISNILKLNTKSCIARGNGMSYGDAAINKNLTITMTNFNKIIDLDRTTGELIAESGTLLSDVIKMVLPQGWFPYVTPGTKFTTLGGAIAADIHGKNHHLEGSFGNYVNWLEIMNEEGELIRCSQNDNSELFNWTVGGMGLTGIITKCSIKLRKIENGWIKQEVIVNNNFDETMDSFEIYKKSHYSVAWLDCLSMGEKQGRSLLILGEHASVEDSMQKKIKFPKLNKRYLSIPFDTPNFLLNKFTVSAFNNLYFLIKSRKSKISVVDWDNYFFQLDSIKNWNKIYGKEGFFQFQSVLPEKVSKEGYKQILNIISNESTDPFSGPFLAVLKKFGQGNGRFSFPENGFTLALDFKATQKNLKISRMLSKVVSNFEGKVYLAKDATIDSNQFLKMINQREIRAFSEHRSNSFSSELSKRLGI